MKCPSDVTVQLLFLTLVHVHTWSCFISNLGAFKPSLPLHNSNLLCGLTNTSAYVCPVEILACPRFSFHVPSPFMRIQPPNPRHQLPPPPPPLR